MMPSIRFNQIRLPSKRSLDSRKSKSIRHAVCGVFSVLLLQNTEAFATFPCDTNCYLPPSELEQLIPRQVIAQSSLALTLSNQQFRNVYNRLMLLRHGAKGVDVKGLALDSNGQLPSSLLSAMDPGYATGGGASSDQDSPFDRFGAFANGNFSVGDKDPTKTELGFDFDSQGMTAGIDYRFSDSFVLGTAFGYNGAGSDFDQSRGSLGIDGYSFSIYSTYYLQDFYVDGIFSGGWNDYDTRRQVNLGSNQQTARGFTSGNEYSANLTAGYDFHYQGLTAGPYGRVSYQNIEIDGYQEKADAPGAGNLLTYGSQSADSLRTALGGQMAYALSTSFGVLTPTVRAEWLHEFNDDSRLINYQLASAPNTAGFTLSTDSPDRDFFNLGAGLAATFAHGASAFMFYEALLGRENMTQHSISAGVRVEF